jgi:hypothetical protein
MDNRSENESARHVPAPSPLTVRTLPRKVSKVGRRLLRWLGARPSPRRYWETRATAGVRSVLDLRHPDAEIESVTAKQAGILFPLLQASLQPGDRRLLDFGCGPGRFTCELARLIDGTVLGVDPVEHYLAIAPRAPMVEYRRLDGPHIDEIDRVLKPGGLLFMVENTTEARDGYYWRFRSADDYRRLFPSVALALVAEYVDIDQRMSVLTGRKR